MKVSIFFSQTNYSLSPCAVMSGKLWFVVRQGPASSTPCLRPSAPHMSWYSPGSSSSTKLSTFLCILDWPPFIPGGPCKWNQPLGVLPSKQFDKNSSCIATNRINKPPFATFPSYDISGPRGRHFHSFFSLQRQLVSHKVKNSVYGVIFITINIIIIISTYISLLASNRNFHTSEQP